MLLSSRKSRCGWCTCTWQVLIIVVSWHSIPSEAHSLPAWSVNTFPQPGTPECRSHSSRLCDPDGILIDLERNRLLQRIDSIEATSQVQCPSSKENIQIAIALVNRMDLVGSPSYEYENRQENAAEAFAVQLHNLWGVGSSIPNCGGTGLLVFFSIQDRSFYISRGSALESSLTDKRIDRVMDSIKPLLRDQDYAKALMVLFDGLNDYLLRGPPSNQEIYQDIVETLIPLSFFILIVAAIGFKGVQDHREARSYARVQTQLSQLDRDRAIALQGRYHCKSCPICLEKFETNPVEDSPPTKGSDGLPLKLLRCGHVFDETCWSEWVSNGTGNLRRCPICQQDVGSSSDGMSNELHRGHDAAAAEDDNRLLRQFYRERNFRLMRLGLLYPRFIRPDWIHRWSDMRYDGSLVQDPAFVRSSPQYRSYNNNVQRGGHSGGFGSFGGGTSGGGRGGSW